MRLTDLIVEPVLSAEQLTALRADADADGRGIVSHFVQEWQNGSNRFDRPGEVAYLARRGERVCGVGGLNRDPYAGSDVIGRVRRLYVAIEDRRQGVARAIVERLLWDARGVYSWLHVRTYDEGAAAFYEARGFDRVSGEAAFTHRRQLV